VAGVLRRDLGGISSLRRLIAEHPEAVHYELLRLGLRLEQLGTKHLTWFDLKAVVVSLPHGNAIQRAEHGEDALWGLPEHLIATVIDVLQAANWQRAGDKDARRPDPIRRPGTRPTPLTDERKRALAARLPYLQKTGA